MALRNNSAEGQTSGTTLLASNSGGASGDAYDQVTKVGSGTVIFDSAQQMHASKSYRVQCPVSTDTVTLIFNGANDTSGAVRAYVRFNALPSAAIVIMRLRNSGGTVSQFGLNSTNKFQVTDSAGLQMGAPSTFATTISTGVWYRIEMEAIPGTGTGDGTIRGRYFLGDSTSAQDTPFSSTTVNAGTTNVTEGRFGKLTTAGTLDAWFDDTGFNNGTSTPIGPSTPAAFDYSNTVSDLTDSTDTSDNYSVINSATFIAADTTTSTDAVNAVLGSGSNNYTTVVNDNTASTDARTIQFVPGITNVNYTQVVSDINTTSTDAAVGNRVVGIINYVKSINDTANSSDFPTIDISNTLLQSTDGGSKNYCPNPSFEFNATPWSALGNTSLTRVPAFMGGNGQWAGKFTATGTGKATGAIIATGLVVGRPYIASFYVQAQPVASTPFSVQGSVGSAVGSETKLTVERPLRLFVPFTATATSAQLQIASLTNNASGDYFLVDLVCITEGVTLGPYFDGDSPNAAWDVGTPGNTTSTCPPFARALLGNVNTAEVVLVDEFCLNTAAWNVTTKTGRYSLPSTRGDNVTAPSARGQEFVGNKPIDSGLWALSMFILGAYQDGTAPPSGSAKRDTFDKNFEKIVQQCVNLARPITLYAWQPDGSVRTTQASCLGSNASIDPTLTMGGRRAELTVPFDILSGVWCDYYVQTIVGVPGSSWANDSLVLPGLVGGTVDIEDSIIIVQGPITNPRVADPFTGTWVQYSGSLSSSQSWIIDTAEWTSKVNGVSVLSNTSHFGYPKFLLISAGTAFRPPSVTLTGSGTGGTTNIIVKAARTFWTA